MFRGSTSHQLGLSSLTLGPPVDTAFMAMDTSELPRQGANLSANRVDFSSGEAGVTDELKSTRLALKLAP